MVAIRWLLGFHSGAGLCRKLSRTGWLGLVLRGIFLCRPEEIHWFYQTGANEVFPDYWQDYLKPIPESERHDMLHAYHRLLTGEDEVKRMAAAKAWSVWEGRTASLLPNEAVVDFFANPHTALSIARIECHYFINQAFLEPNQLLEDAQELDGIPGVIVQGRYDLICPMRSAWELHQAWPDSELKVIPDAGHSASRARYPRRPGGGHGPVCRATRMIGLLQRVSQGWVEIDGRIVGEIGRGLVVLVGVQQGDDETKADRLLQRLLGYRVFPDAAGRMNLSLREVGGGLLLVPQFTLAADTRKGARASFSSAAPPAEGERLFNYLLEHAKAEHSPVAQGCSGPTCRWS